MSDIKFDLFGEPLEDSWKKEWRGAPEFVQEDLEPKYQILVSFESESDVRAFADKIGQRINPNGDGKYTKSIWFPEAEIGRYADKCYFSSSPRNPRYPVYIISKGRWESRLTSKALEDMKVPYRIVVEPQERDAYAAVIDPKKILVLPFSNLGEGSIPARNWVWEHSISEGHSSHWILDDNIEGFYRLNRNLKTPVGDGTIFAAAEDFVDRYENVKISGFDYFMFAPRKSKIPPFRLNTRVYSCILLRNDIPYRWRGRYNEDTDLSIRILKDGYCSILFSSYLAGKVQTMTMKGGNTDELYAGTNAGDKENDGRYKMAKSLQDQHPEITQIVWKWGRWQHEVDYSGFKKNKLILRKDLEIVDGIENYGMVLKKINKETSKWETIS